MQAESYEIHGEEIPLLRLAQKLASPVTSDMEANEIIETIRKVNPDRAKQLAEFRNKQLTIQQ